MSTVKQIKIQSSTPGTYDERDIGADALNIDVQRTSNGTIVTDPTTETAASTESLATTVKTIEVNYKPDDTLSTSSTHPLQNKVVTTQLNAKQEVMQRSDLPSTPATAALAGKIYQYTGMVNSGIFTTGHFYTSIDQGGGSYAWEEVQVQDAASLNYVGPKSGANGWDSMSASDKAKFETCDFTDDFLEVGLDNTLSTSSANAIQNDIITKAVGTPEIVDGNHKAINSYSAGQYLLDVNGNIYEVLSAIVAGTTTLTNNSNVKIQNGSSVVSKLNNLKSDLNDRVGLAGLATATNFQVTENGNYIAIRVFKTSSDDHGDLTKNVVIIGWDMSQHRLSLQNRDANGNIIKQEYITTTVV